MSLTFSSQIIGIWFPSTLMAPIRKGHTVEVNQNARQDMEWGVGLQMSLVRPQVCNLSFILIAPILLTLFHKGGPYYLPCLLRMMLWIILLLQGCLSSQEMWGKSGFFHNAFHSSKASAALAKRGQWLGHLLKWVPPYFYAKYWCIRKMLMQCSKS